MFWRFRVKRYPGDWGSPNFVTKGGKSVVSWVSLTVMYELGESDSEGAGESLLSNRRVVWTL